MIHLKEYNNNLLDDLEDLGVNDKFYSWWVQGIAGNSLQYYVIHAKSMQSAMLLLMDNMGTTDLDDPDESIVTRIKDMTGFSELEQIYSDYDDVEASFMAWEMTPRRRPHKNYCESVIHPHNPIAVAAVGKDAFVDFDQKLSSDIHGNAS